MAEAEARLSRLLTDFVHSLKISYTVLRITRTYFLNVQDGLQAGALKPARAFCLRSTARVALLVNTAVAGTGPGGTSKLALTGY